MNKSILIGGHSGNGKSHSIVPIEELKQLGLNPKETALFQSTPKELPVMGFEDLYIPMEFDVKGKDIKWKSGNLYVSNNPSKVINAINVVNTQCPHIKNIVLDDWQYWLSDNYMENASNSDWELFKNIAQDGYKLLKVVRNLRDDITSFTLCHIEQNERAGKVYIKLKTLGKMLEEKDTPQGRFTIVLVAERLLDKSGNEPTYKFRTKGLYHEDIVKTPYGMFKDTYIPNDLGYIKKTMEEFYTKTKKVK